MLIRERANHRAALAAGIIGFAVCTATAGNPLVLQDSHVRAEFDSATGALTRLTNLETSWTIQRRPDLGVSFRLHAPMKDRRDNFILGTKQKLASSHLTNNQLSLDWHNLQS